MYKRQEQVEKDLHEIATQLQDMLDRTALLQTPVIMEYASASIKEVVALLTSLAKQQGVTMPSALTNNTLGIRVRREEERTDLRYLEVIFTNLLRSHLVRLHMRKGLSSRA